jgi:hypothetical protein
MKFSNHARAAVCVAVLILVGLAAGCSGQERPTNAVDVAAGGPSTAADQQVGAAAAKGAELTAVAIVRQWIAARNAGLGSGESAAVDGLTASGCSTCERYLGGGRWTVEAARVSRHTVDTATVEARVNTDAAEDLTLTFEVERVAGEPVVTSIVAAS